MSEMNRREFGVTTFAGFLALGDVDRIALHSSLGDPERDALQPERAYRYVHLDVFTDRRLQGNQLFVFVQPSGLDADSMQTLTRESNLSECTFVFPPEQPGTDHRVRIFTRTAETPFAGHPTIGTAFALAHTGALKPGQSHTTFGLGVGPTNIDLEWKNGRLAFAWMTQQKPTFGKTITDSAALAAAIGVDAGAIDPRAPAQEVYSGSTFFIVPLATRKAVDAAVLDRTRVDALFNAAGIQRRGLYIFSTERGADDATAYSRMLGTGGIEDPATGSAAGPAGCFIAKHGFVPRDRAGAIVFVQGVLVRRPSRLHVRVAMSGADVTEVKVGGASVVVGEGAMAV
jgi:trans-2,3-dihydro-3-hydroxyanthranilate isomerase